MDTVAECPHCHARFKLSRPGEQLMQCGQCGKSFRATGPAPARGPGLQSAFEAPGAARARRTARLLLWIGLPSAVLLLVGMLSFAFYKSSRPKVMLVNRDTNELIMEKSMPRQDAAALAEQAKVRELHGMGLQDPKVTTAPHKKEFTTDPKIELTAKTLGGAAPGELSYVNGTLKNTYPTALRSVTLTLYIDDNPGPTKRYDWVPAGATIPYSMDLPLSAEQAKAADVQVGSSGEMAAKNMVLWMVNADMLSRKTTDDQTTWGGELYNPQKWPLRNVQVICDYFLDDGSQGGTAIGALVGKDTLESLGKAKFEISSPLINAQTAARQVIRAVGEKS